MRLLVVGAGSTGGYFGGRLAADGKDVTFLVRARRAAQLRAGGLRIASPCGDLLLNPRLVNAGEIEGPYDAVLLAVKSYQLDSSLDDLAPAIGPNTMILPVLNGMVHLERITSRFTPENLVGCAVKVATSLTDDGRIVQLTPLQDIAYGELDGTTSDRILALDAFMQTADIGARISEDIYREMWEKWILLAAMGAITCLARGAIGEVVACAGGSDLAVSLIDEVVKTVTIVDRVASQQFVASVKQQLTARGSPLASSMYRDLVQGRPVEVESIIGDLIRFADASHIDAPLLRAAYISLRVYQDRLDAAQRDP